MDEYVYEELRIGLQDSDLVRHHVIEMLEIDMDFVKNDLPLIASKLRAEGNAADAGKIDEFVRDLT